MKRVIRILYFEGPDEWIDLTLKKSWLQPDVEVSIAQGHIAKELSRTIIVDDHFLDNKED
ncbi:MAG: hypothetical protein WC444_06240 [Candidatus Paceibacterota bacterium]